MFWHAYLIYVNVIANYSHRYNSQQLFQIETHYNWIHFREWITSNFWSYKGKFLKSLMRLNVTTIHKWIQKHCVTITPSHCVTITPSHCVTITPSHALPSHRHIASPSHLHIASPSHRHIASPSHRHIALPSHRHIASPSHRHIASPSHRHIASCNRLERRARAVFINTCLYSPI